MRFDTSIIKINHFDKKKKIKFPNKLTEELAELIGIITGDGHIRYNKRINLKGHKSTVSDLIISGNKKEKEYFIYVNSLFQQLFNHPLKLFKNRNTNEIYLRISSAGLVVFLNKCCKLPLNKKVNINIPETIKKSNKNIKKAFMRGLADTDFSLIFQNKGRGKHDYPVIKGSFKSKILVEDLEKLFFEFGFKHSTFYDEFRQDKRFSPIIMHNIYLYGYKNLEKWVRDIGFSNSKYHRKIDKWRKDGFCPPGY